MNEPKAPLANVGQGECEHELYEISVKIFLTALPTRVERGLGHYLRILLGVLGLIAILVIAAVLFKNLLSALEGFRSVLAEMKFVTAGHENVIVVGSIVTTTIVAVYARRAFRSNRPPPFPAFLWRWLFNELPITAPETVNPYTRLKILLVHDSSTEPIAQLIERDLRSEKLLSVRLLRSSSALKAHTLKGNLDNSDALYLFWTSETKRSAQLMKTILKWADEQSHKPILAVNFLTEGEYDIQFKKVSGSQATTGIWQLLARSTERAYLWRVQARSYWAVSLVAVLTLFISVVFLVESGNGFAELNKKNGTRINNLTEADKQHVAELEKRDLLVKGHLYMLSSNLQGPREILKTLFEHQRDEDKERLRQSLNVFADYAVVDLLSRQTTDDQSGVTQLSFWRKTKVENELRIYEVAWSQNRSGFFFRVDQNKPMTGIVESAFDHEAFVLWRNDLKEGAEAAWSFDGKVIGNWHSNSIAFTDNGAKAFLRDLPPSGPTENRTALICAAAKSADLKIVNGVCLDTTARKPDFINSIWTKNYLLRAMSVMDLAPDNLLLTKKLLKESMRAQ